MSTLSAIKLSADIGSTPRTFSLRSNSVDRLTISDTGAVTVAGSLSTSSLTAPNWSGYTPLNKAGDTTTSGTLNTSSASVFFQVNGNNVYYPGNYSSTVISRGNPGSGNPLLLEKFNEVHVYSADGVNSIQIATTMVQNAVYIVHYVATSSGDNCDPVILPNYTSYSGQFSSFYYGSPQDASGNPAIFNQPSNSGFYFDHYGGGLGNTPCGTFILFNFSQKKHAIYHGGDTSSHAYGTCRWNNNTTTWTDIGTLQGISAMSVRVHVRRVG